MTKTTGLDRPDREFLLENGPLHVETLVRLDPEELERYLTELGACLDRWGPERFLDVRERAQLWPEPFRRWHALAAERPDPPRQVEHWGVDRRGNREQFVFTRRFDGRGTLLEQYQRNRRIAVAAERQRDAAAAEPGSPRGDER